MLEHHNLPISRMGDIDWYLRQRFNFDTPDTEESKQEVQVYYYMRDPTISDEDNLLLHRVYCGNPFVAPGVIGSKTKRSIYINGILQSAVELAADEYFEEHDETLIIHTPPPFNNQLMKQPVSISQETTQSSEDERGVKPVQPSSLSEKKLTQKKPVKVVKKDLLEEMDKNAQAVLLRYRALNSKSSELRHMIVLPIKRDYNTF